MNKSYEKGKAKLKAAFESATSSQEMFKAVTKMARSGLFDENELNLEYFKLSKQFFEEGHDPQKFLSLISGGATRGKGAELKQAFYAATSADEMLRIFQQMEELHIKEEELGMECFTLTQELFDQNTDNQEKILFYGNKALKFFIGRKNISGSHRTAMMVASTTRMLGSACRKLGRFEESLSYLNECERNTSKLESESSFPAELVLGKILDVHAELAELKGMMGRGNEAIFHVEKMLEVQEKKYPEGSDEVGKGNNVVADLYLGIGKFKEAFPFIVKTVGIYAAKGLADDSEKLALLKKSLGIMYLAMKEYEKALQRNGLSMSGLKLIEEMEAANVMLLVGKYEEGVDAMKAVISQAIGEGADFTRGSASVALARALCNKEKFGDAKKYLKLAQKVVEKKQINPVVLATVLENLSKMYKEMEELEASGHMKWSDQDILKLLEILKGLGFKADGDIGVVKEMKNRASGGDSR